MDEESERRTKMYSNQKTILVLMWLIWLIRRNDCIVCVNTELQNEEPKEDRTH